MRLCFGAMFLLLAVCGPVRSTTLYYTLNQSECAPGCGTAPFGHVAVSQDLTNPAAIDIIVTLNSPYRFHDGNQNHPALAFNLDGDPLVSIDAFGASLGDFAQRTGTNFSAPPFGKFEYAVKCTDCGPGYGGGLPGPMYLVVTPDVGYLTPASVVANDKGMFFVTDIVNFNGKTGNVGANTAMGGVPEPSTFAMLGGAVAGLAPLARRRRA